jgi:FlaA1/EpsC-like NDP-sugar epimerase
MTTVLDIVSKRIAITGAGGTVGSALARRIASIAGTNGAALLLIDNSEAGLVRLSWDLEKHEGNGWFETRMGDVRDTLRMKELFSLFKPEIVFHAAAMKHVPVCEADPAEAWKTNHRGTVNVANAASDGAEACILISTDKAADPIGVMGRTKKAAERVMWSRFNEGEERTRYASVRFHNVYGSSASVTERFRRQIERGGPVTVTHPDMQRWFIEADRACDQLLACAAHLLGSTGHHLYALVGGSPVKISQLAAEMIGNSDIPVIVTGVRPGERLEEKLIAANEEAFDVGIPGVIGIRRTGRGNRGGTEGRTEGLASGDESPFSRDGAG